MSRTNAYDLVIIGGGIAGSSLACCMAKAGARVLLLESEIAFRDRVRGEPTTTTIEYAPGAETDARNLATLLGIETPDKTNHTLAYGHVEVVVDDNFSVPTQDNSTSSSQDDSTSSSQDESPYASSLSGSYGYQQTTTSSTEPTPDQGKPIGGGGVPCVN